MWAECGGPAGVALLTTRKQQEAQLSIIAEWEEQAEQDREIKAQNERIEQERQRNQARR